MFERWRQENFFKYLREEYLIDGLVDYQVDPDDPQRSVPNPARKAVDKELRKARAGVKKIQESYGAAVLEHVQGGTATLRTLNAEEKQIQQERNCPGCDESVVRPTGGSRRGLGGLA